MTTIVIILTVAFIALAFLSYGLVLRLVNERNEERDKFTRAIQNQYNQFTRAKKELIEEKQQAHLRGKQEGKRMVLDWIKTQVDDGVITVQVKGEANPKYKPSAAEKVNSLEELL